MTELRRRMTEDLRIRNYSLSTIDHYLRAVLGSDPTPGASDPVRKEIGALVYQELSRLVAHSRAVAQTAVADGGPSHRAPVAAAIGSGIDALVDLGRPGDPAGPLPSLADRRRLLRARLSLQTLRALEWTANARNLDPAGCAWLSRIEALLDRGRVLEALSTEAGRLCPSLTEAPLRDAERAVDEVAALLGAPQTLPAPDRLEIIAPPATASASDAAVAPSDSTTVATGPAAGAIVPDPAASGTAIDGTPPVPLAPWPVGDPASAAGLASPWWDGVAMVGSGGQTQSTTGPVGAVPAPLPVPPRNVLETLKNADLFTAAPDPDQPGVIAYTPTQKGMGTFRGLIVVISFAGVLNRPPGSRDAILHYQDRTITVHPDRTRTDYTAVGPQTRLVGDVLERATILRRPVRFPWPLDEPPCDPPAAGGAGG